jgi:Flp pilus assembly protein TadG
MNFTAASVAAMATGNLTNRLHARLISLRASERGNVMLTFALALIPIVGAVGAAVDYSRANNFRTQLLAAADAASVGSVAKSSAAVAAASTMSSDGAIPTGQTDAINIFNSQLLGKTGSWNNLAVTATVARSNGQVTSTVQFTANVPATFMGLFGKTTIPISGISKAATSMPLFADFYLLLDNTPSMGVGATTSDINSMVANTPDKCAFACHDLSTFPNDYYSKAKSLGVKMRIDVLRTATQQLMDTAKATRVFSNQFRMAVYTFGSSATTKGLTNVVSLTSSLTTAKTQAGAVDLMTVPYQNYADDTDTDFGDVLGDMNSAITTPGSGTSSGSPMKYLFFVSDGVNDRVNGSPGCTKPVTNGSDPVTHTNYVRCQEPLDPSLCATIKSRGIKIAVLYTTYLPLPTNAWYNTWIAPFQSEIATNMQSCASPGLYFEVSPSQGISQAMNALFQKVVSEAHLTQ